MSEIATYTFLPWLRDGIANQITGQSGSRATIPVNLEIHGEQINGSGNITRTISKEIQIYGPGDITGIDSKAIIKVEPRNGITNFEPNYLPYIDFYEEDLPWRYSPMSNPGNHRLLPWLALVVLKEGEFSDGKNNKDRPSPYIVLNEDAVLPNSQQSWAWAHVHVNRNLIDDKFTSNEDEVISSRLENLLKEDPDLAYSRIVCPRRLEDKEAYHAFLVPVFESGRLAGLGENPDVIAHDTLAWDTESLSELQLPYYHRWYFRTGTVGDFEYLVRLLEPKPVDSRVGLRDMDVQRPGANLKGIRDESDALEEQKLHGILKLGGALKVPDTYYTREELSEVNKYENWADPKDPSIYPHSFQKNIANFINLSDNYEENVVKTVHENAEIDQEVEAIDLDQEYDIKNNPDPLITAPLYGRWHALNRRLLKERDNTDKAPNNNWVHELNLDPRWRVAAGFGTKVVQENQEEYMKGAWEQIGDVVKANKKIRESQFAASTAQIWYNLHLKPIQEKRPGKWLNFSSPVHHRVISEGFTVYHQKRISPLTSAATSIQMRQYLRPRGKFSKRIGFTQSQNRDNLIERINSGKVSAAPPKEVPRGIQTTEKLVEELKPKNAPDFLLDLLKNHSWIKWMLLLVALVLVVLLIFLSFSTVITAIGGLVVAGILYAYRLLDQWANRVKYLELLSEESKTSEVIDELPKSPDFRISRPDENFEPSVGDSDSEEAIRFKNALSVNNTTIQESKQLGKVDKRKPLNIKSVNNAVFEKLDPNVSVSRWLFNGVIIPPFIKNQQKEEFVEAMAYPKFDLPMYKPLIDHSAELFLPNINFIEQNSISILETNQKFIEAYMVGLNHEFARELLWREYPTDQRGSYFRQFWEVSGFLDDQTITEASLKARYEKILGERKMPELQEYYDLLLDNEVPNDKKLLTVAHQHILKEELKDIKPLHYWSKYSNLGDHDNRELPGDTEEEVVLVIRGELLKKYPTAVIYAHKAVWRDEEGNPVLNDDQIIDPTKERMLAPIPEGMEDNPPKNLIKSPLYEAKVDPDIYFFGFDLTVCEAKGGTGKESVAVNSNCAATINWDDPGWFFIIKERPGEPRFGLDIGAGGNVEENKIDIWNDMSWNDLQPTVSPGEHIRISEDPIRITANKDLGVAAIEKQDQQNEDKTIVWSHEINAAELAYILYQVPVLVGVHGCEMLPDTPNIS
ncbi:hypothetical protein E7Z59_11610 [Robertkochia marina]|uniref:Uncharacterized protein n=1 Tax=Robertkochia marina TaxID=1227945 RepID=A0A4S3LYE2_9FLAO|nr:hypothetical protein [Robertkochia marina]THD66446.1 hypothetical protein E7Z59_11610 [Robertkochia marina]TRZ44123.1 hypothetical protein D3A96_09420 [Robertkochia marina]